jgi:hypothetical protein
MKQAELAGKFLQLQSNELFQESMEGVMGGGLAGMGLLGTGTPLPQVALQTAGAMALGAGIGILGNRIGARIGRRFHPEALKDQSSLLATVGRLGGQETLLSGGVELFRHGKGQIKQELKQNTSAQLLNEALQNPQQFAGKYGVDPETFKKYHTAVGTASQTGAVLETLEGLSPKQRKQIQTSMGKVMDQGFNQVENLINTQAALKMDDSLLKLSLLQKGNAVPGTNMDMGEVFEALLKNPKPITGEHVGRAAGRFIGDEIGVIAGLGLGGALSGAIGIKSDKDKKIEDLQSQLAGRSY